MKPKFEYLIILKTNIYNQNYLFIYLFFYK